MGESSFFFTGPTFTSFWRLVSWHFFNFTVWIIKECILWWLWVRLCSWLSFCHWWKVNSTDHFSSTLTKLDSVTIMVKENPPAGTSKSLLLSPLNIHSCFLLYLIRLEFPKMQSSQENMFSDIVYLCLLKEPLCLCCRKDSVLHCAGGGSSICKSRV